LKTDAAFSFEHRYKLVILLGVKIQKLNNT